MKKVLKAISNFYEMRKQSILEDQDEEKILGLSVFNFWITICLIQFTCLNICIGFPFIIWGIYVGALNWIGIFILAGGIYLIPFGIVMQNRVIDLVCKRLKK